MRKLTPNEDLAARLLDKHGPLIPGDSFAEWSRHGLIIALDGLVKKRHATVQNTDDGPRYQLIEDAQ